MTALFVRNIQPPQYEPAHAAGQIVAWYSGRLHIGLWGLLMALPMSAFIIGCVTLWRRWKNEAELRHTALAVLTGLRGQLAAFLVAGATFTAAGVLAIVALHAIGG